MKPNFTYPRTWTFVEPEAGNGDAKTNPEFFVFSKPVTSSRTLAALAGYEKPITGGPGSFIGVNFGSKSYFTYDGKNWVQEFRKRNPGYVAPPRYVMVYGAHRNMQLRMPGTLPWHKTLLPAMNRLCRTFGVSFFVRDDQQVWMDGGDAKVWAKSKVYDAYDYVDGDFVLVRKGRLL